MAVTDPYKVLGIPHSATDAEIRAAYRSQVQRHHPDHNGGSPESARRFEEVQEAYALIRKLQQGTEHPPPGAPPAAPPPRGARHRPRRAAEPVDPGLEARLAEMDRELKRQREAKREAERNAQRIRRTRCVRRGRRPAPIEADRPTRISGYVTTDDSFSAIFDDAASDWAKRFSEGKHVVGSRSRPRRAKTKSRQEPVTERLADLFDGWGARLRGEKQRRPGLDRQRCPGRIPGARITSLSMALADIHTDTSRLLTDGLLGDRGLIGGEWVNADSGATFAVMDPGTGEQLGTVPSMGEAETARAIAAAEKALPGWRARTAADRAKILRKLYELMMANQDALGELLSREQGKPFAEAKGEIAYAAGFIEWFGEEGKRAYGEVIPGRPDRRIVTIKQPVGVVAAITPWNFPSAMITRKLGPALAAGCTMVLKPAATPFSALALAQLAEAGVPAGVFSVVTGSARPGDRRRADPQPRGAQGHLHRLDRDRHQLLRECADT